MVHVAPETNLAHNRDQLNHGYNYGLTLVWPLGHLHGQHDAPLWQIGDLALGHALHGDSEVALYVARVLGAHVARVRVMARRPPGPRA